MDEISVDLSAELTVSNKYGAPQLLLTITEPYGYSHRTVCEASISIRELREALEQEPTP